MAADLCDRFKQHNGIIVVDDNSCKRKQIDEYFSAKEKLGYTIFVRSPLSQPITHKNEKEYRKMLGTKFSREDYVGKEGQEHIKQVEGILIEAFKKANGDFPLWNRMGGSLYGQRAATIENYLHAVRMSMLISGMTYGEELKFHNKIDLINRYQQVIDNEYFQKRLKI